MTSYRLVLVTAPSEEEAKQIALSLVESQLAASVSITPVFSTYTWLGKLERHNEWQLMIRTKLNRFETLEAKVRELHSYEVPEIIAIPIVAGSQPFLDWIDEHLP
ncbi:divalent-cation tolerance protein CutA [Roseofilum sp. BLCC_M91]|uniref:Divalent-cation tolerance protein CutA n=1 Tax=Roseofilum halophilum BLCC-M91 TaxID=3022259 RepID=A0ABT7BG17_9CYAN|nr:divalent-cation tolerance protein CutA [Roseofilum halophilum]MDJ1177471.1 divalent-cation tolerance protein CutA [Roseofilum halophilum BLCC-M91]